jgi:peptidyl-tRNA hydrolase, PTH1 family
VLDGRPAERTPRISVLDRFTKAEREEVELLIEDGADAVETLIRQGLSAAQERHNRRGEVP